MLIKYVLDKMLKFLETNLPVYQMLYEICENSVITIFSNFFFSFCMIIFCFKLQWYDFLLVGKEIIKCMSNSEKSSQPHLILGLMTGSWNGSKETPSLWKTL